MDDVEKYIQDLKSEDAKVRMDAAFWLGEIGDASAVPALVEALGDEDADVGWWAATALECIILHTGETIEALESLEEGLKQGFSTLRKKRCSKNELIEFTMKLSKLMQEVSEKKNELASKRDILLKDKPKPPKRGKVYQAARGVRNG